MSEDDPWVPCPSCTTAGQPDLADAPGWHQAYFDDHPDGRCTTCNPSPQRPSPDDLPPELRRPGLLRASALALLALMDRQQ